MAFWNRESPEDRESRLRREKEQEESLEALRAGRLPLHAQQRLREQSDSGGFFTSDLSTNEHFLVRHAQLEPVGQVMGSSFYRTSYRGYYTSIYQPTGELVPLTNAQLANRGLAVSRLKQEAALLGADGVIGVRLTSRRSEWADRVMEFTAIGTAVRFKGGSPFGSEEPFTSALSGQDFWKLHDSGFVPKEIAFGLCSFYIHSDFQTGMAMSSLWGSGMANQELHQYTAGFREARDIAMMRFAREVKRARAQGAVGVNVDWDCEEIEYEVNETRYVDLLVHFAAVGTAIVARPESARTASPTLTFYDLKDRASFQINPEV